MTQPTFSIITIVLNDPEGLERTAKSIYEQTCQDFEHIIIDGASDNPTQDVIKTITTDKTVILSEKDKGIYDAMNKGLKLVKGKYFQFLNAGDVYENDHILEKVKNGFDHSGSRLVYGNNSYFDETGKTVRYWKAGNFKKWKIYCGWVPAHPTAFADSKLIDECGNFDSTMKNAGDYDLFLRWFLKANVIPYYLKMDVTRMEIGGFSTASYGNALVGMNEVKRSWKQNGFKGGFFAPYGKIIQKIPQKIKSLFKS